MWTGSEWDAVKDSCVLGNESSSPTNGWEVLDQLSYYRILTADYMELVKSNRNI